MTKKIVISLTLFIAVLLAPQTVGAQYGQQVLGEKAKGAVIVHEPVEAGIFDNPLSLAVSLLLISLSFTYLSRKAEVSSIN